MLVLNRTPGDEIVIAGNIRIRVCSIDRNKVRLGITAPRDVPVHRAEIQALIDANKPQDEGTPESWGSNRIPQDGEPEAPAA